MNHDKVYYLYTDLNEKAKESAIKEYMDCYFKHLKTKGAHDLTAQILEAHKEWRFDCWGHVGDFICYECNERRVS